MIKVIIADDHHLVRQGIRAILEKVDNIQVTGEAEDGMEAVRLVESLKPDVIIMDIAMPCLNGCQAIAKLKTLQIDTKAIVLSMYLDTVLVRQALQYGAKGYLLKRSITEELLLAIHSAINNEIYLSPAVANILVSDPVALYGENSILDVLSLREREVLQLITEGHTNQTIAQLLVISSKTVEKHRASIMAKLDIHDMVGLVKFAIKNKLITID